MIVKIKRISPDAQIPSYAKEGDAGFDLNSVEDYVIKPFEKVIVKTGLQMEIPKGYVGLIWDRSGLATKNSLHRLAGVVDSSYRGEVGVVLFNLKNIEYKVNKGDRIAQMLIQSVERVEFEEVSELEETVRGECGFGHTGK